ncbi:MAG: hypothetical protein NVSMB70_10850 [Chamaesiphon sp.]
MSYYISPRFLDKVAVHITKNFLTIPKVRVPLILGIHGRKGEGKSFQCELVFERMGIEPVHMSAGELESPDAGDPGRLIRLRYREAAEFIRVRGKMCVLMINDLDAGAGRFDLGTQYTVNTQLVNGTLMNIADKPTDVQLPGSYDSTPLPRVPIIVTGNDFSTLYAPLIRDGRMDKFYWEPDRSDKIGIISGIFEEDGLSGSHIEQLVDTFSHQAIDFFGALRARIYDEQIRQFIDEIGVERVSSRVVNSVDGPPAFKKPDFRLPRLIEYGQMMVQEQNQVQNRRLVEEYNTGRRSSNLGAKDASHKELAHEPTKSEASYNISGSVSSNGQGQGTKLSPEVLQQLQDILKSGYRVGMEYADERRFRTNGWKSCASIQSEQQSDAIAIVENCLADHTGEYVRLIGIDSKVKRRVVETIIQRPNS